MSFASAPSGPPDVPAARGRDPLRRNIPVFYLFNVAAGFFIWLPVWILYLIETRGLSLTQVALMEGVFWIAIILTEVPTGAVADRWGRRVSLALGGFGFTIASFVFAFAGNFPILLVSYILMAIALTLFTGSGPALLFDTLRHLRKTREFERTLGRSEAIMAGSLLAATLLGGPLAFLFGYQGVILIGAASMSVAGVIALFLREPPRTEADIAAAGPSADSAADSAAAGQPPARSARADYFEGLAKGVRVVFRTRTILYMIPLAALAWVIFEVPEFLFQYFLLLKEISPTESLLDGFIFSLYFVPIFVGSMAGSMIAAPIADRFGERAALPVVLAAGALAYIALVLFDDLGVIAAIAVVAACRHAVRPIAIGYINRRIGSDQRATVLSVFELVAGGSMAVLVLVVGPSADVINLQVAYGIALLMLVVIGGALWFNWDRAHRDEPPVADMDEPASYVPVPIAADERAAPPPLAYVARSIEQRNGYATASDARSAAASDAPIPISSSSASES